MGVSCTACGHHYKPGEKFHNHQNDSFAPWDDTPAPLSADSLRETLHNMLCRGVHTIGEEQFERAMELIAAALQSERRRIADSLPEKKSLKTDLPLNAWEDDARFCVECGQFEQDGVLDCKCVGFNEAIEAVRAVLIPPTGKLGGLDKPSEPAESKDTKSITGASASEEER